MGSILAAYRTDPRTFWLLFGPLAFALIASPFGYLTIGAFYHG